MKHGSIKPDCVLYRKEHIRAKPSVIFRCRVGFMFPTEFRMSTSGHVRRGQEQTVQNRLHKLTAGSGHTSTSQAWKLTPLLMKGEILVKNTRRDAEKGDKSTSLYVYIYTHMYAHMDGQPRRLVLKYNPQNPFFAQHCQDVDTF